MIELDPKVAVAILGRLPASVIYNACESDEEREAIGIWLNEDINDVDLILLDCGPRRISITKVLRHDALPNGHAERMGLQAAAAFTHRDALPSRLEFLDLAEATDLKKAIEDAGGRCCLVRHGEAV